jgi:hypothetical protein
MLSLPLPGHIIARLPGDSHRGKSRWNTLKIASRCNLVVLTITVLLSRFERWEGFTAAVSGAAS